jgi:ribose transport system substrate-binding protein
MRCASDVSLPSVCWSIVSKSNWAAGLVLGSLWLMGATGCQSEIPREMGDGSTSAPSAVADAEAAMKATMPSEAAATNSSETPTAAATAEPSASSANASSTGRRIILLTNGNSPYWDACRTGLLDAQRELNLEAAGLTAVMEVNDGTPQGQIDKLRQFGSQSDVVAIGVSVIDEKNVAVADEMRKLRQQGVQVITIDSDVNRELFSDARAAFIGTDNLAGGQVLGQCAAALLPEGGEYVTFVGRTGAQNAIERIGGFAEGAGERFQSKDSMADNNDNSKARENVRNALRNHPNLNVLVGIWSYNAPAIVDVVKEAGIREKTKVVVFDAEPLAIQHMQEGQIDAMVVQDPYAMGYQGVRYLKAMVEKDAAVLSEMLPNSGQPGGDIFDTGLRVVVPSAESPIKAELFTGKVQFMTLEAFREQLTKFGLIGS